MKAKDTWKFNTNNGIDLLYQNIDCFPGINHSETPCISLSDVYPDVLMIVISHPA